MSIPYRRCSCCGLDQPEAADPTGVTARVCANCTHHQGDSDARRLARAGKHEAMLRERLDLCRQSEAAARADQARAREAVASALSSRGRLAARIVAAADTGGRDPCLEIARDLQVMKWARGYGSDAHR